MVIHLRLRSNGNGNWNTYMELRMSGTDPDGIPDGDDYVTIEEQDVTVTANAGFGHLEFSASGTIEPTLTINSGSSLVGYTDVEDGAITFTASGGKLRRNESIDM